MEEEGYCPRSMVTGVGGVALQKVATSSFFAAGVDATEQRWRAASWLGSQRGRQTANPSPGEGEAAAGVAAPHCDVGDETSRAGAVSASSLNALSLRKNNPTINQPEMKEKKKSKTLERWQCKIALQKVQRRS